MTELERKCGNCDHCLILSDQQTGECHIRPPGSLVSNKWPLVDKNDWCGEFKPKGHVAEEKAKAKKIVEKIRRDERTRIYNAIEHQTCYANILDIIEELGINKEVNNG